ncbi:MAG: DUF5009 domain-containing protein [candidate division KSB1 bacterium]|nr:DUF5009 domain-containing protein [candidate division KSB1 bacterium]
MSEHTNPNRLLSLDAFRGLTIAGMILVNNPGTWSAVYPPLRHAAWHGWTPTDLIFPFFLFIVGVAMTFSFAHRLARGDSKTKLYLKVIRRTLIIFGLGLFLNGFPYFNLSTIRIPGVLQRIALCYFFASIVTLEMRIKGQAIIAAFLLILYWVLMKLVPVPGYGAGVLEPEGNLAAYIDNALLHGHLWKPTWDPEGLLSTLPAISTTLLGVLTGHWLHSSRSPIEKAAGLLVMGNFGLVVGVILDICFPINKYLWTSSYVVFMAGMALNFLGVCYWLIDVKGYQRWATPFLIYGTNAIAVYVLSSLVAEIMTTWKVTGADGSEMQLKTYLFEKLFASWASPINASLFFALTYVLIWLGLMALLYRKRIFIKI